MLLKERFNPLLQHVTHIDYIIPAPLLCKTLYTNSILNNDAIHLFLWFQNNDACITLYIQGEMYYFKSLRYSFGDIAQRLREITGKDIELKEVLAYLSHYGVRVHDLEQAQPYTQLFAEIFTHIHDVIIYIKRSFNIEHIDTIYFSSSIGFIPGIDEFAVTYLSQKIFDFSFDYGIETDNISIHPFHILSALSLRDIIEKKEHYPNFSIFHKPPSLYRRPTGKLLIYTTIIFFLSILYPIYQTFIAYKYKYETALYQKKYTQIHAKRIAIENRINTLQSQMTQIQKHIMTLHSNMDRQLKLLQTIYDKKVHYIMKASTLSDLTQSMYPFHITTVAIDVNNTHFDFNVTAPHDRDITQFIKYITFIKGNRYHISTSQIKKIYTKTSYPLYTSHLKVTIR